VGRDRRRSRGEPADSVLDGQDLERDLLEGRAPDAPAGPTRLPALVVGPIAALVLLTLALGLGAGPGSTSRAGRRRSSPIPPSTSGPCSERGRGRDPRALAPRPRLDGPHRDWSLPALVFSGALGGLLLRLVRPLGGEGFRRVRLARLPGFLLYFLKELLVANLKVAAAVVAPAGRLRPAIVAVPLTLDRDAEIALLANLITLTPGTLSLDVSPDRRTLYVHAMAVSSPDDLRREIRDGFERRILEVFR